MKLGDVQTPALIVERSVFDANVAAMAAVHPGPKLRPHVKAFKSTALAAELAAAGHRTFCCATTREVEGMAAAGLGDDLLLANEVLDPRRLGALGALVAAGTARITAAVDSPETVDAVAAAGLRQVLIDVNVGLPRCGCDPGDAGVLADRARAAGLEVRGVMGYEGHLMREPHDKKAAAVEAAMKILLDAQDRTGGDVVSAGGTGTYDVNPWATEIQAGSYVLMDTEYVPHAPAFGHALSLWTTVVSVNPAGWAVADCGLKSLGMDHGEPTVVDVGRTWFTSDEHVTFGTHAEHPLRVGDRVRVLPAHVDPTVAMHEQMVVVDGTTADADVLTTWPVDLRGW